MPLVNPSLFGKLQSAIVLDCNIINRIICLLRNSKRKSVKLYLGGKIPYCNIHFFNKHRWNTTKSELVFLSVLFFLHKIQQKKNCFFNPKWYVKHLTFNTNVQIGC